jgi:hypothetical protein
VPVTTAERTLVDLSAVVSTARLRRALHEAELLRLVDFVVLDELLDRHRGRSGIAQLRALRTNARLGTTVTRSELEQRFLELVERHGLPVPQHNAGLWLGDRRFEVDCLWAEQRLVAELDGHAAHGTRRAFEADRERDRLLQVHGWRVIRVTWRHLHEHARALEADLRLLLGRGRDS